MAERKSQTSFKKGSIDFKGVLFNQLDRTLRCLTESNYIGFVDGVEGLYLILIFVRDAEFIKEDNQAFKTLDPQINYIANDVSLWPDDQDVMFSQIGIRTAKIRLANLIELASRKRLLLEKRREYGEDENTESERDPTEDELRELIDSDAE